MNYYTPDGADIPPNNVADTELVAEDGVYTIHDPNGVFSHTIQFTIERSTLTRYAETHIVIHKERLLIDQSREHTLGIPTVVTLVKITTPDGFVKLIIESNTITQLLPEATNFGKEIQ
jgi:hypothetical protein